jgi:hypothetical protein
MPLSRCPSCQGNLEPDQEVCGHCGYRLGGADPDDYRLSEEDTIIKRPTGVTFLALLYAIIGGFVVVTGLALLVAPDAVDALLQQPNQPFTDRLLGAFETAGGIGCLAFAFGAWYLRQWARILGFVVIGAGVVSSIPQDAAAGSFGAAFITTVIGGLMIWYLLQPHVKEAFGLPQGPPGPFEHLLGAPAALPAPPVSEQATARPAVGAGLVAGIAVVVLYVAGLGFLYGWGLSGYVPKPLATAAPGSVGELCFSDTLQSCDPSTARALNPRNLTFRFTGEGGATPFLTISRIEGDRERKVLGLYVLDMDILNPHHSDTRGVGMYGPFTCAACGESATYVGRILDGSTLVAEGFFRT